MSVPARTADPVFTATIVASIDDAAQLSRPATHDRTENLAVSHRHPIAERLEICRCVLPQAVRHRKHRLLLTAPTKELLDRRSRIDFRRLGQMQVDHGRLQAAVAEILLDDT